HVNHSKNPPANDAGECEGMGQISMKISALPGSVLSENQHARDKSEKMKETASSSEGAVALVFDPKGFLSP
ncbi:hypothetical protein, partial [Komagataeibacter rhaeticus]|uniref:hypothetical protein n=1 Tax=Komagataeibacter rhaeticus TaxID=215221 RepID=UPI001CD29E8F